MRSPYGNTQKVGAEPPQYSVCPAVSTIPFVFASNVQSAFDKHRKSQCCPVPIMGSKQVVPQAQDDDDVHGGKLWMYLRQFTGSPPLALPELLPPPSPEPELPPDVAFWQSPSLAQTRFAPQSVSFLHREPVMQAGKQKPATHVSKGAQPAAGQGLAQTKLAPSRETQLCEPQSPSALHNAPSIFNAIPLPPVVSDCITASQSTATSC